MIKLEEVSCNFEIVEMPNLEGITLNKNNAKITIYDKEIIEKVIDENFNKKYRTLLYLIMSLNDSEDTTETDTELAFLKIDDLKNHLLKYYKFISKDLLNKYLSMLMILGEKIPYVEKNRGR